MPCLLLVVDTMVLEEWRAIVVFVPTSLAPEIGVNLMPSDISETGLIEWTPLVALRRLKSEERVV